MWRTISASVTAGLLLGPLDLVAQKVTPYPWANLANSSAAWALGAFALCYWLQTEPRRSAAAGVVLLLVAVESYYLAAVVAYHDSVETLTAPATQIWLIFAVVAGALFGVAGSWARSSVAWRGTVGVAIAGSVFFAEAFTYLYRISAGPELNRVEYAQTALIELAAGCLVVLLTRRMRQWLPAFVASVPLTVIGFGAFVLGGFGR
jgi:hypothetical protein